MTKKTKKKNSLYTKFFTLIGKMVFPKSTVSWEEQLKDGEVAIFACNHSGAIGPALTSMYLDIPKRPWVINYIFNKKKAVRFVFHDFLFAKDKKCKPFYWIISFFIAKLLPPLLLSENPIPVYHSQKMMDTFVESVDTLVKQDKNLVVFPEKPQKYSEFIFELYSGFVDIAHQYYKETGKSLRFFPTYVCGDLRKIVIGKPITYDPSAKPKEQRQVISTYVKENIDRLGRSLPKHKTVPFLPDVWFESYGHMTSDMSQYWALFD